MNYIAFGKIYGKDIVKYIISNTYGDNELDIIIWKSNLIIDFLTKEIIYLNNKISKNNKFYLDFKNTECFPENLLFNFYNENNLLYKSCIFEVKKMINHITEIDNKYWSKIIPKKIKIVFPDKNVKYKVNKI